MLTLYYAPGACSLAAHIMLEEVGATFETVRLSMADGDLRKPDYLALNPHGRVPTLVDDGFSITECPAILSYLGHRFADSGVLPLSDLHAMARCEELISFFSSAVHIAVRQIWRTATFSDDASSLDAIRSSGRKTLLGYFGELDALATVSDWLVGGRFSVADLYPLVFYRWGLRMGEDMGVYENWTRHVARMIERPGVQRAVADEGLSVAEFQPMSGLA